MGNHALVRICGYFLILNGPAKETLAFVHNISKCLNGVKLIIYGSIPFDFFFWFILIGGAGCRSHWKTNEHTAKMVDVVSNSKWIDVSVNNLLTKTESMKLQSLLLNSSNIQSAWATFQGNHHQWTTNGNFFSASLKVVRDLWSLYWGHNAREG